jgi:hypothetical protein
MADLLPGLGGVGNPIVSSVTAGVGNVTNVLIIIVGIAFFSGVVFGIFYLLHKLFFEYRIPVTLRFKVGETILKEDDMMKQKKKLDKFELKFKRNKTLMAEEVDDKFAIFFKKGGKNVKGFEGFVKEGQVAWIKPEVEENQFVTVPTNLVRYHVDMSRRNAEIAQKLKWYQNPMVVGLAIGGVLVVSIIFIYIMHKSVVEEVGQLMSLGAEVLKGAQLIK